MNSQTDFEVHRLRHDPLVLERRAPIERVRRFRKAAVPAIALALAAVQAAWAAPFEMEGLQINSSGDALSVSWESTFMDTSDILISTDLENYAVSDSVIAGHDSTTAEIPMNAFGGSPHGFVQVRTWKGPASKHEFPCYYIQNWNWNYGGDGVPTVHGRVRFPSQTCNSGDGPPAGRPVVIFMHGNGMDFNSHNYLMAFLARNGFVTASISNGGFDGGSNEGRAREAISYLNSINAFWGWKHRLSGDVIFMGHSRGGEAAATAARLLAEQPSLAHVPYNVKAVVSIAPTDGGGGGGADPKEHLDGNMTRSFLALYGSRDGDVIGNDMAVGGLENTAFAMYDRAGSELSVEGLLLPVENITKSMVYVYGANHRGFRGDLGFENREWQMNVAKGYINAFLRWQVFGEAGYKAFFDGRLTPKVDSHDAFLQFSDRPRRVLDNFEQGGWAVNSRGGAVTKGSGILTVTENNHWGLSASSPHDGRGLRIRWNGDPVNAWMRWNIPDDNVFAVGPSRDVSSYGVLSLRIAQNYLAALNSEGEDLDFRIGLITSAGVFPSVVKISDYGRIPYPDPFVIETDGTYVDGNFVDKGDYTKTAMSTIRIPLTDFQGVNLNHVEAVVMLFAIDGHEAGSINIDNLEFSQ